MTLSESQSRRSHGYGLNKPTHFHPEVEIEIAHTQSPESKQGGHAASTEIGIQNPFPLVASHRLERAEEEALDKFNRSRTQLLRSTQTTNEKSIRILCVTEDDGSQIL